MMEKKSENTEINKKEKKFKRKQDVKSLFSNSFVKKEKIKVGNLIPNKIKNFEDYINISFLFRQKCIEKKIILKILDSCITEIEKYCQNLAFETSGLLLGKIIDEKEYVILEVSDGGKNERRSWASVTPDKDYFDHKIEDAERRGLVYLGEWHKHPGYITHPSGGDNQTIKAIFKKCPQLSDFIMFIVINNHQNKFDFFAYYFNRNSFLSNQIDFIIIESTQLRAQMKEGKYVEKESLKEEQEISIEELLMKEHFPTLKLIKTTYGMKWKGNLFGIKTIIEKTDNNIKVTLYENGQNSPNIYILKQKLYPIHLIWLDKLYKLILKSLSLQPIWFIKLNKSMQKSLPTYLICLSKIYKKISKLLSTYLIWMHKKYDLNQKSLPMHLIWLEARILQKIKSNLNESSIFLQKISMINRELETNETQNDKKIIRQWYKSEKGQKYLTRQKQMLRYIKLLPSRYQFSIIKGSKNLRFKGLLDKVKDLNLIIDFPKNFLEENIFPIINFHKDFKKFQLSEQAMYEIRGETEIFRIFLNIHNLNISGVDIYE